MVEEKFSQTGNFWIDFGIVSLWGYLLKGKHPIHFKENLEFKARNDVAVCLSPDALVLSGGERAIDDTLNESLNELKNAVWGKTRKGKDWWKPEPSFFFKQFGKKIDALLQTPNKLKKSGKFRKRNTCNFCGQSNNNVGLVRLSEQPLIVTKDKMMTFYSGFKGKINICTNCTFASHFAPARIQGVFSKMAGNTLNMMIPEATDLIDLARLLHWFGQEEVVKRVQTPLFGGFQNILETSMKFLFETWKMLDEKGLKVDEEFGPKTKRFHVAQLRSEKKVTQVIRYYLLPDIYAIFNAFNCTKYLTREGKTLHTFEGVFNHFYFRTPKLDTHTREELSYFIIHRMDLCELIEKFLYERELTRGEHLKDSFLIREFGLFVEFYEGRMIKVEESVLGTCKSVGENLGELAFNVDDAGILYTLRSVRNLDDFLASLQSFLTRYVKELQPKFYRKALDDLLMVINDKNWKRFKALVGIYAVLKYMGLEVEKRR